jgi:hypothetical protein
MIHWTKREGYCTSVCLRSDRMDAMVNANGEKAAEFSYWTRPCSSKHHQIR